MAGSARDAMVGHPPFEVLVLPYAVDGFPQMTYAVLRSRDGDEDRWHGLSGLGRHGEKPIEAARRHAWHHAGVPEDAAFLELEAVAPERDGARAASEYAFAALVDPAQLQVPDEYELCWVSSSLSRSALPAARPHQPGGPDRSSRDTVASCVSGSQSARAGVACENHGHPRLRHCSRSTRYLAGRARGSPPAMSS
jgi:hypothetical protein